jgi:hypothetical protein
MGLQLPQDMMLLLLIQSKDDEHRFQVSADRGEREITV